MKILVFTSLFPNNIEQNKGIFIKERMRNVARFCEIKVIAPVPYFPRIRFFKKWFRFSKVNRQDKIEGLEVYYPRFFMVPKIGMSLYGVFMFLSVLSTVSKIKKGFNFDLIDAHYVYPDGLAAVLLGKVFKKPVVVSARGTDINVYPKFPIIKRAIIHTLKNAKKIISVCQALKDAMVELGIKADKIEVIPNGVDIKKFKPISKIEARKELNLSCDKKIVVSVGHLIKGKGFQYIIGAIAQIKREFSINKVPLLVIVGEGEYRSKLEHRIKELGLEENVLMVGEKSHSELCKWYSSADLFCLASSREGWPNVIFESLACGVPVVATNVNGVSEVIKSEKYGILVGNQDDKVIADAIAKALNKDWDVQNIIKYAEANTWDKIGQKVHSLFQAITLN